MEKVVIIGAGPAGIGTGIELLKENNKKFSVKVIDKNDRIGGLARTYFFANNYFDIGPHRFYTRNKEVINLWNEILGKDFKKIKRLTRIYYNGKLFLYPIQLKDILTKLGFYESFLCLLSYFNAKIMHATEPKTFEDWVTQKFGSRLYKMFFKSYTEKVWGIDCKDIGAEWASQRIKNLDFLELIKSQIWKSKAKSLVGEFYYPTKVAGYMYEKAGEKIKING